MEKKPKIQKVKQPKKKIKASSLAFVLLSLVLTIALFFGLVLLQNVLSEKIVYQSVVVAKEDIPENTILTMENADKYLTMKNLNILDMTSTTLTSADDLLGRKARVMLSKGECVTLKDFEDVNAYTKDITDPVEVSIEIASAANADGGKLRTGDLINITMMYTKDQLNYSGASSGVSTSKDIDNSTGRNWFSGYELEEDTSDNNTVTTTAEDGTVTSVTTEDDITTTVTTTPDGQISFEVTDNPEAAVTPAPITPTITDVTENPYEYKMNAYNYDSYSKYVMENVCVSKVLDSNGAEIASTDKEATASILVFTISKADEPILNEALVNCTNMRISKVLEHPIVVDVNGSSTVQEDAAPAQGEETETEETAADETLK